MAMSLAKQLREELDRMVNVQFETPEFIKFLSIKYTMPRARLALKQNWLSARFLVDLRETEQQ